MEPISTLLLALGVAEKCIELYCRSSDKLHERRGKISAESLREEILPALDALKDTIVAHQDALARADEQLRSVTMLQARIEWLELPFYKRWFTQRPATKALVRYQDA